REAVGVDGGRPVELRCVGRWVVVPRSERPEVLRYAGRWVVAPPSAQAEVLQYADQWAVVPLSGRPAMPPCVGLRATLQLGVPDHTRTFIAGHILTFTVPSLP